MLERSTADRKTAMPSNGRRKLPLATWVRLSVAAVLSILWLLFRRSEDIPLP